MKIKRIVIAVVVMLACCWCSFKGYEMGLFQTLKPAIKHGINFSLLLVVALVGYGSLRSVSKSWVQPIWVLIYAFLIILLPCIGIIDIFSRINNYNLRDLITNVRMLFTSPLPFAILLFISYSGQKKVQGEVKSR